MAFQCFDFVVIITALFIEFSVYYPICTTNKTVNQAISDVLMKVTLNTQCTNKLNHRRLNRVRVVEIELKPLLVTYTCYLGKCQYHYHIIVSTTFSRFTLELVTWYRREHNGAHNFTVIRTRVLWLVMPNVTFKMCQLHRCGYINLKNP